MQVRTLIHDAVTYLQGQDPDKAAFKNDVGFSKADSQVGHIAANLPPSLWTPELTVEIAAVLVKYLNTQLTHFDGDAIREVAAEARGRDHIHSAHKKLKAEEKLAQFRKSRKIVWERWQGRDFRFVISWDWNDPEKLQILDAVRDLPGRDYVPYRWGVPAKSWLEVRAFAEVWHFSVCDDCIDIYEMHDAAVFDGKRPSDGVPDTKVKITRIGDLCLVPEPTVDYVEPPFPLYPHQPAAIEYLRANDKAMLTDDMGLGKTVEAVMAAPSDTAMLVICPASLKSNWERELKIWRPDLTTVVLKGRGSFRWPVPGEAVIMNYELLPKVGEASYLTWEVNAIVDEAHYLKKAKSARTDKWRSISRDILEAGGSTWGMTGTPLITNPYDLYGCLQSFGLLKQGYGSYKNFVSIWGGQKGRFGLVWNPRKINEKLAQEGLAKCTFGRKRIDALPGLPSKRHTDIEVKLPKGCGAIDREDMDALEAWADGGPTPIAGKIAEARKDLAIAKGKKALPFIDELIQGGGGPIVVFSAHVQPCQELGKYDRWECITGDTPVEKRAEIVERFQNGELDGLAGTVGAMGVGLTLTKSCRMIFLDLPWSNSEIAQAEDRICRIGQKNACEYFLITSNSEVDQIIHKSITRKTKMTDNVDAVRSN